MTNLLPKITFTTATIAISLISLNATSAIALTLNFNGEIESGDLTGATYQGTFNFSDPQPNFSGIINVENINLELNLNNFSSTFTENNAISQPLVEFDNGNLLGLDYGVKNAKLGEIQFNFQFTPGFFDVNEAAIFYDVTDNGTGNTGQGGIGNVQFTTASEKIPEPTTILGSGFALGIGALLKHRRNKNNKNSN
ncbi:MAG: PEP-CTERM sorting domain-containing protein [Microcoleaceae cyanobacterium MO_207.B10]|nr:PEP-CTERM sorting domain-containing protein [Microcoleaceae cyanobacterium MO_207.B10]